MTKILARCVLLMVLLSLNAFAESGSICSKMYSDDVGPEYLTVDDSQGVATGRQVVIALANANDATHATVTKGIITASISSITSYADNVGAVLSRFDLSANGEGNLRYSQGVLLYQNGILKKASLSGVDGQNLFHQTDYGCRLAN